MSQTLRRLMTVREDAPGPLSDLVIPPGGSLVLEVIHSNGRVTVYEMHSNGQIRVDRKGPPIKKRRVLKAKTP
jgi:hypothetical protein